MMDANFSAVAYAVFLDAAGKEVGERVPYNGGDVILPAPSSPGCYDAVLIDLASGKQVAQYDNFFIAPSESLCLGSFELQRE